MYCLNQYFGCQCSTASECNKNLDLMSNCGPESKNDRWNNISCLCALYYRECDPNRCIGCCGEQNPSQANQRALLSLAKSSKYITSGNEKAPKYASNFLSFMQCQSMNSRLHIQAKVLVAPSNICRQIAGLYTMDSLTKG